MESLAALGVTNGIDNEAVETACKLASLKGSASAVLARGRPALSPGSQAVTWLVPGFASGPAHAASPSGSTGPSGSAGRAGVRACSVTQGQALAELSVSAAELKGFDVTGKVLEPGAAGPELVWDETAIAAVDVENGKRLTAKKSGELCFEPGGVPERLTIRSQRGIQGDVGKETGNVKFSGELRIAGKVQPGYSVIGGKDVLIGGSADAALISAGGKAVIAQGINGGGRGVVRARNSIEAAFAEHATLLAVEDIKLQGRCEGCTVKTNGRLIITGKDGKLSGGLGKSREGLSVPELGAEGSTRTEISFGQDYLIQDQIEAGEREIEKINAALDAIEPRIKKTQDAAALKAAREEKVRLLKLREQFRLKVFTLRERFEEHHDSEIAITGAVHPGVVMESHDRYYEISEKRSGVVFFFDRDSGRIRERPI
jgi:uncharacterized protein (DUF342 family)